MREGRVSADQRVCGRGERRAPETRLGVSRLLSGRSWRKEEDVKDGPVRAVLLG